MVRLLFHQIIAWWVITLLLHVCSLSSGYAAVVISELYRDPPGLESVAGGGKTHEFVELCNTGSDTFFLEDIFLTNGTSPDSLCAVYDTLPDAPGCRYGVSHLAPGEVGLILDRDYLAMEEVDNGTARFSIPPEAVILTIDDNEFGRNGLVADHGVVLYRGTATRIDTILCSAADTPVVLSTPSAEVLRLSTPANIEGYSLERGSLLSGSASYKYAADSISPGKVASISNQWLLEYHLRVLQDTAVSVECSFQIVSFASPLPEGTPVTLSVNRTVAGKRETVLSTRVTPGGSVKTIALSADSVPRSVVVDGCDSCMWPLDVSGVLPPAGAVHISELFPRRNAAEREWFELYNSSEVAVDCRGWRLVTTEDTAEISPVSCVIAPRAFLVVARDADDLMKMYPLLGPVVQPVRWASLDNDIDTLSLSALGGGRVETVWYDADRFASWPAVSLERLDFSGGGGDVWSVAMRSTPGMPGVATEGTDKSPEMTIGPVPFTPDNDLRDDRLKITLSLPPGASADVSVYGFDGSVYKTFMLRQASSVYWDGDIGNRDAPPGPFFVVAEILDSGEKLLLRKKGLLWRTR